MKKVTMANTFLDVRLALIHLEVKIMVIAQVGFMNIYRKSVMKK
jgi:hypothetical protein